MWKSRNKIILLMAFSCISLNASSYFDDGKRGWFWGEEAPKEEKEKPKENVIPDLSKIQNNNFSSESLKKIQDELKKKDQNNELNENVIIYNGKSYKTAPLKTSVPWEILDTLHPDEISKLETETKNISVTYPTMENVTEYKKLQKYLTYKALAFTDTSYLVTKTDGEISEWASESSMNSRVKIDAKRMESNDKTSEALALHKDRMIILVATSETCSYCKKQIPLLKEFNKKYDIEYKEIDIVKNKIFATKYQVQRTPDLFLLYKDDNNEPLLTRFGSGLQTLPDIESGLVASLVTFNKLSKDYLKY